MANRRIDSIPIELFELARQRSKAVGQKRAQSYRDIALVAQQMPGIINQPMCNMEQQPKEEHEQRKKILFDFRI